MVRKKAPEEGDRQKDTATDSDTSKNQDGLQHLNPQDTQQGTLRISVHIALPPYTVG